MKILTSDELHYYLDSVAANDKGAGTSIIDSHEALRARAEKAEAERDEYKAIGERLVPILQMAGLSNIAYEFMDLLKKYKVKP